MTHVRERHVLVSAMRGRLVDRGWPRVAMMLIVALSGAAAFGISVAALRLGVDDMALRYPSATLVGYVMFILLIRVWIVLHRDGDVASHSGDLIDAIDAMGEALPASSGGPAAPEWFGSNLDVDEAWFIVLAILCALGGLIAIAYVVYIAPVMLAEVALDAALVSTVYRRLRREDAEWWAISVLRRTWLPAAALTLFVAAGGFALQQVAPDARSIGGVVQELLE